jgi:hypothetical protein
MANNWVGTYRGHNMYAVSAEEFRAMNRRERNKVYLVGKYMVLNDNIVGIFDNYIVKPAEQGANIYDIFGIERPVVAPKPQKKRNVARVEVPVEPRVEASIDTLVE